MTKRKATGVPKNTFRSAYNLGNEDYSETFNDGITEQHHTDQCDINKILAQFMETGIMPQTKANPQYGDVSQVDFQEMQNTLATAKTMFEELPEQVKATFNNEMHSFLNFAENPDNLPQMEEWGLAVKNERLAQALQAEAGKETPEASLSAGKSDESDAAETVAT
ncbi:internal scaffolding protein [Microviridae sp.]|nr:internal scaffolding protein [Microviridae sp.]